MPMPAYRNTNYSPLYALLGMTLICVLTIAGFVFQPSLNNWAGKATLREFKLAFQAVQHPAGTESLSLRTSMGEFTGSGQGCDFFVGEVRRFNGMEEMIIKAYLDQAASGYPLQVVFLENRRIPDQVNASLPEALNDLAGWELPPGMDQQPMYLIYLVAADHVGDVKLDCP